MNYICVILLLLGFQLPFFSQAAGGPQLPPRLQKFISEHHFYDKEQFQHSSEEMVKRWLREYDKAALPELRYLQKYPHCIQAAAIGDRAAEPECRLLENLRTTVSDLPEFRTVIETNSSPRRRQELFVDYGTQFILNPNFQCVHPTIFRFFNWYFYDFDATDTTCADSPPVFLTSIDDKGLSVDFESFDSNRLYQVHYLFASEGPASFSRFGHAMIRLVFCSPYRKTMGPECLKDLLYHRVVSFRASVVDIEVNAMDGLTGKYPSILFISPFLSIIKEYNGPGEFRDLISLPLALNPRQNRELLKTIIDTHLNYQGHYYFFSNNCATETLRLFKQTFFTHPQILASEIVRPDSLYQEFRRLNLARGNSLGAFKTQPLLRQTLKRENLFFPSEKGLLDDQLEYLKLHHIVTADLTLEEYFNSTPSMRRLYYERQSFDTFPVGIRMTALHRAISLEVAAEERLQLQIQKQVQQILLDRPQNGINIREDRQLRWALSSPKNFNHSDSERLRQIAEEGAQVTHRIRSQLPLEKQRQNSEEFLLWLKQKLASLKAHY